MSLIQPPPDAAKNTLHMISGVFTAVAKLMKGLIPASGVTVIVTLQTDEAGGLSTLFSNEAPDQVPVVLDRMLRIVKEQGDDRSRIIKPAGIPEAS